MKLTANLGHARVGSALYRLAAIALLLSAALSLPKLACAGTLGANVIGMFPKDVGEFGYADMKKARTLKWFPQLQEQVLPERFRQFEKFLASTGNEAVTSVEDLIAYAIEDPATRLIVAFVEQFRNPPALFDLAERAHAAEKPVILLKAGLTQEGGAVSRGHTGAMVGSGAAYRQALRQANFILVDDFDELAQTVELAASWAVRPASFRVGMLGTSGGELSNVTDQCVEHGVKLPALSMETLAARLEGVNRHLL